ncbi:MAG: hypothetical protein HY961_19470 [Ignavibacteriae bacterium]|nr:hypothetical protein [Ignavibacteriota bacterium]
MKIVATILLFVLLLFTSPARAQQVPAAETMADSLHSLNHELLILQDALEAATVDNSMLDFTSVKAWELSNATLRDSVFFLLLGADSSLLSDAGANGLVIATNSNDLIEIRFGSSSFKGDRLRNILAASSDKGLYQRIATSYPYSKGIELREADFKIPTPFEPLLMSYPTLANTFGDMSLQSDMDHNPRRADISLFGVQFKASPDWGAEFKLGNDEIGFPFWSSGKMAFLATYKRVKFGFELPFSGGLKTSNLFPPFVVRARHLNGTRGIVGQFDFGMLGGLLSITRLTNSDLASLTSRDFFYYISAVTQLYYSFGVYFSPSIMARAKVGGALYRVNQATVGNAADPAGRTIPGHVYEGPRQVILGPHLSFEYLHRDGDVDRFRGGVQFFDMTLLLSGEMAIIEDVLSLELKYAWPVGASRRPWQTPEYLIASPHIKFGF